LPVEKTSFVEYNQQTKKEKKLLCGLPCVLLSYIFFSRVSSFRLVWPLLGLVLCHQSFSRLGSNPSNTWKRLTIVRSTGHKKTGFIIPSSRVLLTTFLRLSLLLDYILQYITDYAQGTHLIMSKLILLIYILSIYDNNCSIEQ
jgi:hypothetical protein